MSNSRSKNAGLNVIVGFLTQFGTLLLSFISRRIFIEFLSVDYLGINGLYSNILSVLSLAELGLGSVMQFSLYKPVTDKDYGKVRLLISFAQKIYICIATAVFLVGITIIPLLKYIINSNLTQSELIIYYVLFLINSVVSYFAASRVALLAANQDNRLQKTINFCTSLILQVVHIAILVVFKNYMLYVMATVLSTVAGCVWTNIVAGKRYPYLKEKIQSDEKIDKKPIIENVKSTFVYKIGATVINYTTNILISALVSTLAVGLYSNYYLIVNAVQVFIGIISASLISGIGSLSTTKDEKRMNDVFNAIVMLYQFIGGLGSIGFFLLLSPVISVWLGDRFVMDTAVVFAIALNFYVTTATSPVWIYRESNGLFAKVKYLMLITAAINIVLSIILGKKLGVAGILLSTAIAKLLTMVWYEPRILYKHVFKTSVGRYWKKQIKHVIAVAIAAVICCIISSSFDLGFVGIVLKAVIFTAVCLVVFFAFNFRSEEFKYIKNIVSGYLKIGGRK